MRFFGLQPQNDIDEQIVELFFVVCTYRMHGMFIRALHLEFDTDPTARMQEVSGPEDAIRKAYEQVNAPAARR